MWGSRWTGQKKIIKRLRGVDIKRRKFARFCLQLRCYLCKFVSLNSSLIIPDYAASVHNVLIYKLCGFHLVSSVGCLTRALKIDSFTDRVANSLERSLFFDMWPCSPMPLIAFPVSVR